jgi:hypothetical protein
MGGGNRYLQIPATMGWFHDRFCTISGAIIACLPTPAFPKNRISRYVPSYLSGGKQQATHPGSD